MRYISWLTFLVIVLVLDGGNLLAGDKSHAEDEERIQFMLLKIIIKDIKDQGYEKPYTSRNLYIPAINAYYVAVDGGYDPSEELISKLSDGSTPICRASQCINERGTIRDYQTKEPGIKVFVSSIWWHGSETATVSYGYFRDSLWSLTREVEVSLVNGQWAITRQGKSIIS